MSKWTIEMPDGWKPGGCGECKMGHDYEWDKCPLSHAVEATANADLVGDFELRKFEAWFSLFVARLYDKGIIRKDDPMFEAYKEFRSMMELRPVPAPKEGILNGLCKEAVETSKSKGWKHDNDGQAIALMHSELSEALEAMRKPDRKDEHLPHLDPVGLELADVLIRVFDFCGARGIDLDTCVKEKMAYNKNRPMKHGGKAF